MLFPELRRNKDIVRCAKLRAKVPRQGQDQQSQTLIIVCLDHTCFHWSKYCGTIGPLLPPLSDPLDCERVGVRMEGYGGPTHPAVLGGFGHSSSSNGGSPVLRNKYVKNAAAVIGKVGLLRYSRYICRGREEEWTGFVSGNTEMKGKDHISYL